MKFLEVAIIGFLVSVAFFTSIYLISIYAVYFITLDSTVLSIHFLAFRIILVISAIVSTIWLLSDDVNGGRKYWKK